MNTSFMCEPFVATWTVYTNGRWCKSHTFVGGLLGYPQDETGVLLIATKESLIAVSGVKII